MKSNIILATLMLIIIIAFACNQSTPKTGNKDVPELEIVNVSYTCPMHPEIHSDKPGKCPICGMDLVKEEIASPDSPITK